MENQNLQLDFTKYKGWTGPAGIFGSYREDHLGAVAFSHYLNQIKRENGDKLPYDSWEIINPEGFLAFIEAEQAEGKNYENLIKKTKEMIRSGEMNYDSTLYFAKAFNDLGFLYKRDEEVSTMYENLAASHLENPQNYQQPTAVSELKSEETSSVENSSPEVKTEEAKEEKVESASSTEQINHETESYSGYDSGLSLLSGWTGPSEQKVEDKPLKPEKVEEPIVQIEPTAEEIPVPVKNEIPQNFDFKNILAQETTTINTADDSNYKINSTVADKIPVENYTVTKKTPKKRMVMLPQERKFNAPFENMLRTRKTKRPKKFEETLQQTPQMEQGYNQRSETSQEQSSYRNPAPASAGFKIAKRMAVATGGSFLGLLNMAPSADASEFAHSIIGIFF